jgi:aminomethyltransferase
MGERTTLHSEHGALGARMVEFAGWEMPIQYAGLIDEHRAVRNAAGLFDLGHMAQFTIAGPGAAEALESAVVSAPTRLAVGGAQYSLIVDAAGGMLDDLVIYRLEQECFLLVANASNRAVVARELRARLAAPVTVSDPGAARGLIAIQGPFSEGILAPLLELADGLSLGEMPGYTVSHGRVTGIKLGASAQDGTLLIARTGYTGEDGFELYVDGSTAPALWRGLLAAGGAAGLQPIGLGARDTLRLEAGMPLYGNELRVDLTPYDVGLGRVVRLEKERPFVGDDALRQRSKAAASMGRCLVGLRITGRGIARHEYVVQDEHGMAIGHITSGTHSPTLGVPIAFADVAASAGAFEHGRRLSVLVRDLPIAAEVVAVPFIPKRTKRRAIGGAR